MDSGGRNRAPLIPVARSFLSFFISSERGSDVGKTTWAPRMRAEERGRPEKAAAAKARSTGETPCGNRTAQPARSALRGPRAGFLYRRKRSEFGSPLRMSVCCDALKWPRHVDFGARVCQRFVYKVPRFFLSLSPPVNQSTRRSNLRAGLRSQVAPKINLFCSCFWFTHLRLIPID